MAQGISLGYVSNLLHRLQAERTARGSKQDFIDGILVFADQTLEDGRVLAIDGKDGSVVLLGQLQNQLSSYNQRLFVGQTNGLASLDGMDGGVQS